MLVALHIALCFVCGSMVKTLERYQKCSYGSLEVNHPGKDIEVPIDNVFVFVFLVSTPIYGVYLYIINCE